MFLETGKEDWLSIGKIVSAHGLKGELRVNPFTDFPERFLIPGERWLLTKRNELNKIELEKGRKISGKCIYIIAIKGIHNRSLAEKLIGQEIACKLLQSTRLKKKHTITTN